MRKPRNRENQRTMSILFAFEFFTPASKQQQQRQKQVNAKVKSKQQAIKQQNTQKTNKK